jgi:hypothetical protein
MPNTEVKLFSADGSWGFPPVRVGHRQALLSFKWLSKEKLPTITISQKLTMESIDGKINCVAGYTSMSDSTLF